MWQSERQQREVIQRLLAPHHALAGLWTPTGPTKLACEYFEHGSPLSSSERILLDVAFAIWNGGGKATVGDLLCTLDERNLRAVCVALLQRDGGINALLEQALKDRQHG